MDEEVELIAEDKDGAISFNVYCTPEMRAELNFVLAMGMFPGIRME